MHPWTQFYSIRYVRAFWIKRWGKNQTVEMTGSSEPRRNGAAEDTLAFKYVNLAPVAQVWSEILRLFYVWCNSEVFRVKILTLHHRLQSLLIKFVVKVGIAVSVINPSIITAKSKQGAHGLGLNWINADHCVHHPVRILNLNFRKSSFHEPALCGTYRIFE